MAIEMSKAWADVAESESTDEFVRLRQNVFDLESQIPDQFATISQYPRQHLKLNREKGPEFGKISRSHRKPAARLSFDQRGVGLGISYGA